MLFLLLVISASPLNRVCDVDLLDAGDGRAIHDYVGKIRRYGFKIVHTGEANDAHERAQIFHTEKCRDNALSLAKAIGVAEADVALATWKTRAGIVVVPPGKGRQSRRGLCELEMDYKCTRPTQEEIEDLQMCFCDPGDCKMMAITCEQARRTKCNDCDDGCAKTCDSCAKKCDGDEACRSACAQKRLSCAGKCGGESPCEQDAASCEAAYRKRTKPACDAFCKLRKACVRKQCRGKDPDSPECVDACGESSYGEGVCLECSC